MKESKKIETGPTLLRPGFYKENPEIVPIKHIINTITQIMKTSNKILVLESSTGSGKSTVLPVELHKYFSGRIVSVQPRIFNTLELPKNILQHYKQYKMGENLGYQSGSFQHVSKTGILFVTAGTFVQQVLEMTDDKICSSFKAIIIDEAHMLDTMTSVLLLFFKYFYENNGHREDCPLLIVTSATFDAKHFCNYFTTNNHINIIGFSYPIEKRFLEYNSNNFLQSTIDVILKLHTENTEELRDKKSHRDILVFVSGQREMRELNKLWEQVDSKSFRGKIKFMNLNRAVVLEGGEQYKNLFKSADQLGVARRVIISTNIGETGITYPFLKYVIDTGYNKTIEFNPDFNLMINMNKPVTRFVARQRKGRIGRTAPGVFFGIYSRDTYKAMNKLGMNEIYTKDMSFSLISILSKYKDLNMLELDLIYKPAYHSVWRAVEKLYLLGFITSEMRLTEMGNWATNFKYFNVEQIKIIMSAYVWHVSVPDAILVAIATGLQLKYKHTLFMLESQCDFIPIVEEFYNFMKGEESDSPLHDIFPEIMEQRDSCIESLALIGLNPFENDEYSFPNGGSNYVKNLKQCLYEGLKINSAYWKNDRYVTVSGFELYERFRCHVNNFVYSEIELVKEKDKNTKKIKGKSVLDGYINFTPDFF